MRVILVATAASEFFVSQILKTSNLICSKPNATQISGVASTCMRGLPVLLAAPTSLVLQNEKNIETSCYRY